MKRLKLTNTDKLDLEVQHIQTNDGKERDRIKAILLRSEGWTVPNISQALRIHESTVTRHINDYRDGKLKNESGGSSSYLDEKQTAELISHIEAVTYFKVEEIVAYVKNTWSINYSVPGMNKWLHKNGFSYKKPKGRPYKADKELQEKFIKHYELIKSELKKNDEIYFMDGVHPTQATKIGYGWIRKGKTKDIETSASRTRLNILGAMSLSNISGTVSEQYKTINSESIIDLMNKLKKQHGNKGKVYIILDRAPYNRSDSVFKEAEKLNIKLEHLPAYSPNLNPIERLWKVMNEKVRNNRFFKNPKDFRKAINKFFKKILPDIGNQLSKRINDNFQAL